MVVCGRRGWLVASKTLCDSDVDAELFFIDSLFDTKGISTKFLCLIVSKIVNPVEEVTCGFWKVRLLIKII